MPEQRLVTSRIVCAKAGGMGRTRGSVAPDGPQNTRLAASRTAVRQVATAGRLWALSCTCVTASQDVIISLPPPWNGHSNVHHLNQGLLPPWDPRMHQFQEWGSRESMTRPPQPSPTNRPLNTKAEYLVTDLLKSELLSTPRPGEPPYKSVVCSHAGGPPTSTLSKRRWMTLALCTVAWMARRRASRARPRHGRSIHILASASRIVMTGGCVVPGSTRSRAMRSWRPNRYTCFSPSF